MDIIDQNKNIDIINNNNESNINNFNGIFESHNNSLFFNKIVFNDIYSNFVILD